ncbi:uncharacterized protein LOC130451452 [Diorhabda sublineata]|uniref:uncharacterized protein LOC130451452 n=1 Tax=Diorhabda sublineata TaxID=1163346 RepID=UPI0024E165D0|nr:uncharacterized protein LOC130451452 [Diorhabda sublineata]
MGGCRCSYKNCQNTTKTTENVHFFHYPVKHIERCKLWIEKANKPHFLDLEEDQLRNKVICEYHFEDKWFPNSQKKRLLLGAVPTLDVGCEKEQQQPDMYVSTGMQDIQLLPASSDGSLFILDTDSIFSRSNKIDSFVYKNGMIIPSQSHQSIKREEKPKSPVSKASTSKSASSKQQQFLNNNFERSESPESNVQIKNESTENEPQLRRMPHKNVLEDIEITSDEDNLSNSSLKKNTSLQKLTSVKTSGINKAASEKANLAKNYLRKIKQHSRDIACIKKMLRQKSLADTKPDTNTILNCLKEQLPPTFFTVLSLTLSNKFDLTEADIDFFTTIHKMSPAVYQLLVDKYKWSLPSVDVVETPME